MKNKYSEEEIEFLKNNYTKMTSKEIAAILGRSLSSVRTMASDIGVTKSPYNAIMVGHTYGCVTTIAETSKRTLEGAKIWECLCYCGSKKWLSAYALRQLKDKCNCKKRLSHSEIVESEIKRSYSNYKYSAKKKNLSFIINTLQFNDIVKLRCHYCGFLDGFNGIDRKNNDLGYDLLNCLPACSTCNMAKKSMTYDAFLEYLDRVSKFKLSQS